MLEQALAMSMGASSSGAGRSVGRTEPDFNNMSEEEQIAYAMQMSMADTGSKCEFSELTRTDLFTPL